MTSMPEDDAPRAFVDVAGDALRYWEPRRLIYNIVLLVIVVGECLMALPEARAVMTAGLALLLFILAVFANIAYCTVCLVDLFVQFSGVRQVWIRWRWTLLFIGTAFASALAHFFMRDILTGSY
jgi:hypothetical protein